MKTIILGISRGLVCRNILRTGVLDALLAHEDVRVVLAFPKRNAGVPDDLRQEFSHPRIHIEAVDEPSYPFWIARIWMPIVNNLVYSDSTDLLASRGSAKVKSVPTWWYPFHRRLFRWLSTKAYLKRWARWIDLRCFTFHGYDHLMAKYTPSMVFVGALLSKMDIGLLKFAAQHNIPSCGMQKGWDNLQRVLIRTVPSVLLVQNPIMIDAAKTVQLIPETQIRLVGFSQFDLYTKKEELPDRAEFFRGLGVDPDTRAFLFGSEGLWTPQDERIIEQLLERRGRGAFPFPTVFIVRPHFSDISKKRYDRFKGTEGVIVDDAFRWGTYFPDYWDPTKADMRQFATMLRHVSAVICFASTLSLDGACMDTPLINVGYGAAFRPDGTDITGNLYRMDHYLPVMESGAVEIAWTEEALHAAIVRAAHDPSYRSDGRRLLRERMCGPLDGQSSSRIADALLS